MSKEPITLTPKECVRFSAYLRQKARELEAEASTLTEKRQDYDAIRLNIQASAYLHLAIGLELQAT